MKTKITIGLAQGSALYFEDMISAVKFIENQSENQSWRSLWTYNYTNNNGQVKVAPSSHVFLDVVVLTSEK